MAIGIAIGTAIGVATYNIGFWLPLGIVMGAGLSSFYSKKNDENETQSGEDLRSNLDQVSESFEVSPSLIFFHQFLTCPFDKSHKKSGLPEKQTFHSTSHSLGD